MRILRAMVVSLLTITFFLTGPNAATSVQPMSDDLLMELPAGVWIRGTKVKLIDAKLCWNKSEKPVLYAKLDGRFEPVAKGRLFKSSSSGCKGKHPLTAVYRFTLKDGGAAQKMTLRSGEASGVNAKYIRTIYSSVNEYNNTIAGMLGVFEDLLTGDKDSSNPASGAGSQTETSGWSGCYFNGQKMWGTVKIVDAGFADSDVKVVDYFQDLKVKRSYLYLMGCGEWEIVNNGYADFSIKLVDYFPDFTVKFVDFFPGR
jgi:hypothetical protein